MQEVETPVQALEPSLRPLLLPEISAKLALGARFRENVNEVIVSFEGDLFSLHQEDFTLCLRASDRVRAKLPNKLSPGAVIQAVLLAQQFISEELFRPNAVRVLFYATLSKASAFYRCLMPHHALNQGSQAIAHATAGKFTRAAFEYDVVVFQIDHSPGARAFAKALKTAGKKIVYELDDAFDKLEEWHPGHGTFDLPARQDSIREMLALADAVQVSTPWLAKHYADRAKRIVVIPNMIELFAWPRAQRMRKDGLFKVVWAGSDSHKGDLEEILPALSRFARDHSDVRIVFFGQQLRDALIPERQVEHIPWCEFEEYPFKLADIDADLAISPLANVPFNLGKSNLRILQYWATGYPVIASNVGPYAETITPFQDGLLASTTEEWVASLQWAYENKEQAKALVKGGYESVKRYDIHPNIPAIEGFYVGLSRGDLK